MRNKKKTPMDIFEEAQRDIRPKKHYLVEFSVDGGKTFFGEEIFAPTSEEAIDGIVSSHLTQNGWMSGKPFSSFDEIFDSSKEKSKFEKEFENLKNTAKVRLLEDVPAKIIKKYRADRHERDKSLTKFREEQNKKSVAEQENVNKTQHRAGVIFLLVLILVVLTAILFSK